MATSETDICNLALVALGESTITALTDDEEKAEACNVLWSNVRDAVLAEHPWNGCCKRVALSQLNGTPAFGFTYQFSVPPDCLRILEPEDQSDEWIIELATDDATKVLLANVSEFSIRYIFRNTNVTQYAPGLVMALAARMAAELTQTLTAHRGKFEDFWKIYVAKLALAKTMDGQEGSPRELQVTTLTTDVR